MPETNGAKNTHTMKLPRRNRRKKQTQYRPFDARKYFSTPREPQTILNMFCIVYGGSFDSDRLLQVQGNVLSKVNTYDRKKLLAFGNVIVVFSPAQIGLIFTLDELAVNKRLEYFQSFIGDDVWHNHQAIPLKVLVTKTEYVSGALLLVLEKTCLRSLPFDELGTHHEYIQRHMASLNLFNEM